jgi:hypothetical protein
VSTVTLYEPESFGLGSHNRLQTRTNYDLRCSKDILLLSRAYSNLRVDIVGCRTLSNHLRGLHLICVCSSLINYVTIHSTYV